MPLMQKPLLTNVIFLDSCTGYNDILSNKWHTVTAGMITEGGALGGKCILFPGSSIPHTDKYVALDLQHLKRRNIRVRFYMKCAGRYSGASMVAFRDNANQRIVDFGITQTGNIYTRDDVDNISFAQHAGLAKNVWHNVEVGFKAQTVNAVYWYAAIDNKEVSQYRLRTSSIMHTPIIRHVRLGPAGDDCKYSDIMIHSGVVNKHTHIETTYLEGTIGTFSSACEVKDLPFVLPPLHNAIQKHTLPTAQVSCAGKKTIMGGMKSPVCGTDGDSQRLPHPIVGLNNYSVTQVCHMHPWLRYMWTPEGIEKCGNFCMLHRQPPSV